MGSKVPQLPPCKQCGTLPKAGYDAVCEVCHPKPKKQGWFAMFWKRWMRCDDAQAVEVERLKAAIEKLKIDIGLMAESRDFYAASASNRLNQIKQLETDLSVAIERANTMASLHGKEFEKNGGLQHTLDSIASLCRSERIQTSNAVFDSGKYGSE